MDREIQNALDWYIQEIKNEIVFRNGSKFRGCIEFKLNFVDGGLAGMNVVSNKNLKFCNK